MLGEPSKLVRALRRLLPSCAATNKIAAQVHGEATFSFFFFVFLLFLLLIFSETFPRCTYADAKFLRQPPAQGQEDVVCGVQLVLSKGVDGDDGQAVPHGEAKESEAGHTEALFPLAVGVELFPHTARLEIPKR